MDKFLNSGKFYKETGIGAVKKGYTEFGKQIQKELVEKNMTQRELAKDVGCSYQYLYKILVGERSGDKYSEKIRQVLGID